jgi:lysophospholipase L1-like esterase
MWDLKQSFPDRVTINHGFGGSELEDSLHFADRIIIPHAPKIVFLYAGDNDINKGKTAERVVDDYQKFVKKLHRSLPKTRIVFLPIKPSLSRWEKWPEMKKANLSIQTLAKKNPLLDYLDTATPMMGKNGKPMPDLFKNDGLHLNDKGYLIWNKVLKEWLKGIE